MKMTDNKIKSLNAKRFLQGRSGGKEVITRLKYTGGVGNLNGTSATKVEKLKGKSLRY